MNKILISSIFLFTINLVCAQNQEVVDWLSENALSIENTNQTNDLSISFDSFPKKFKSAKVYGFGEASHQHKEFINLKVKFLKFLITQNNLKAIFIEESFGGAYAANQYIRNRIGKPYEIVKSFKQGYLKSSEILSLLKWLKNYNEKQQPDQKIEIYGMDCMFNYNISEILLKLFNDSNVQIENETLRVLEKYKVEKFEPYKIEEIKVDISAIDAIQNNIRTKSVLKDKYNLLAGLEALKGYITFMNEPTQNIRDQMMSKIILSILNDRVAFISAHNYHIQKGNLPRTSIPSLGNLLAKNLGDEYYSMGFDFGLGKVKGYTKDKKWKEGELTSINKNTFAKTLYDVSSQNYYVDFQLASSNEEMNDFLTKKGYYIGIGGYGILVDQIKYSLIKSRLSDLYDGLIFVKNVTLSSPSN